jgi:hypothetical protein
MATTSTTQHTSKTLEEVSFLSASLPVACSSCSILIDPTLLQDFKEIWQQLSSGEAVLAIWPSATKEGNIVVIDESIPYLQYQDDFVKRVCSHVDEPDTIRDLRRAYTGYMDLPVADVVAHMEHMEELARQARAFDDVVLRCCGITAPSPPTGLSSYTDPTIDFTIQHQPLMKTTTTTCKRKRCKFMAAPPSASGGTRPRGSHRGPGADRKKTCPTCGHKEFNNKKTCSSCMYSFRSCTV